MVFSSLVFLFFFLPAVILVYYLIPAGKTGIRNFVLLVFSLLFYAWGGPIYTLIMLAEITVAYAAGILIGRFGKAALWGGVAVNLSFLFYYKYFNFLMRNVNGMLSVLGRPVFPHSDIFLPIGISFFTFQSISYIADVYSNDTPPQKNFLDLALYISFFPQLIAGPIVQYSQINTQIVSRKVTSQDFAYGIRRFILGLSKKVLIANEMAWTVDRIYRLPAASMSTSLSWIAAVSYFFQIYYDFSGYSDMAIGLGRMFGFSFMENFDYPYLASSVREFWTRWHISLSSFFRKYVYIPLGGNRKGIKRTLLNLLIVFTLTGIWHGASWQYLFWGLYHGFFQIIERSFLSDSLKKHRMIGTIYTLTVVMIGWVLFRGNGLSGAIRMLSVMFRWVPDTVVSAGMFVDLRYLVMVVIAAAFCGPVQSVFKLKDRILDSSRTGLLETLILAALMFLSVSSLVGNTYNPFIYFQF